MKKRVLMTMALALGAGLSLAVARPGAQSADDLLGLLPDGNTVAVVDVRAVTASPLWAALMAQGGFKNNIEKAEKDLGELGLKLTDLHKVAAVFSAAGLNDPTLVVAGGFDQQQILARLRDRQDVKLTSEPYKGVEIYSVTRVGGAPAGPAQEVAFAFHNASTVAVGKRAGVRASVDARAGAAPSVAQNQKLAGALAQNPASAISFAMIVTPGTTGKLQSSQLPLPDFSSINLIFGTVDVTSNIALNATLRNHNADQARAIADQLNGLLSMARGFFGTSQDPKMAGFSEIIKTVSITNTDVDVKVTGTVPPQVLAQLLR